MLPMWQERTLGSQRSKDPGLSMLKKIIRQGRPERIKDLPKDLRAYWSFRDELTLESRVIFKGKQVLNPESMTESIITRLHASRQGTEKTRRLARESVYWTKMNEDTERICESKGVFQTRL